MLRFDCCWLLVAAGMTTCGSPAGATEPGLLDYFQACGIGSDAFAKLSDDRQISDEELDVIRRVAVRLHDCPADRLRSLAHEVSTAAKLPALAEAKDARGRMFSLQGTIESVAPVEGPDSEPLWRCTVALSAYSRRVVVYVAGLPGKLRTGGAGKGVAIDGVFMKFVPSPSAEPLPVVVAPRIEWRPDSPLGKLGMNLALFEGIQDRSRMTAADHDAFYRLLQIATSADTARLIREAQRLDDSPAGLPALFRDPASQRGRLVRLSGTALRAVRIAINEPAAVSRLGADHYFEIDLVADGSQNNPVVFCALELPEGMTSFGPPSPGERVEVTGFFLKSWQYPTPLSAEENADHAGSSQALQTAPLLIGRAPLRSPAAAEKRTVSVLAVSGLLALVIAGVCLLSWHLRQSDREFSRRAM
jgi:hypothetical protein